MTTIATTSVQIRKASGELEPFELNKLESSLHNAGADRDSIAKVLKGIESWIYDGITTKQLYSKAFNLLRKLQRPSATRYKLKRAIYDLGPSGYPFEAFMGQVFERLGYTTETGIIVKGQCLNHEMDVIATNDQEQLIMECKFHKDQGHHVGIQVPLYVHSRVNDIIDLRKTQKEYSGLKFSIWVVTNTRFSTDAIQYSRCKNVHLLAWDFPRGKGIKELVEQAHIFPVTILTHLLKKDKLYLLEKGIVSCHQLYSQMEILNELDLSTRKKKALIEELEEICN
jgi:hypothetical protein